MSYLNQFYPQFPMTGAGPGAQATAQPGVAQWAQGAPLGQAAAPGLAALAMMPRAPQYASPMAAPPPVTVLPGAPSLMSQLTGGNNPTGQKGSLLQTLLDQAKKHNDTKDTPPVSMQRGGEQPDLFHQFSNSQLGRAIDGFGDWSGLWKTGNSTNYGQPGAGSAPTFGQGWHDGTGAGLNSQNYGMPGSGPAQTSGPGWNDGMGGGGNMAGGGYQMPAPDFSLSFGGFE